MSVLSYPKALSQLLIKRDAKSPTLEEPVVTEMRQHDIVEENIDPNDMPLEVEKNLDANLGPIDTLAEIEREEANKRMRP